MSSYSSTYDLPIPRKSLPIATKGRGKRKRGHDVHTQDEDETIRHNVEYAAIVTPEERTQRRLAGHALDQLPPAAPFPHAPPQTDVSDPLQQDILRPTTLLAPLNARDQQSLRAQHLSVMTTILHRCLEQKDFVRASKVLATLTRSEISGRAIDLRNAGLWGIAAEILLRDSRADEDVSREGFEKARTFYNKMAMQFPWHRSWPNVINAQDFKLVMLSVWIYVVYVESQRIQARETGRDLDDSSLSVHNELQAKRWELTEAEIISKEMDSLMGSLPFADDPELVRLRAMVALWTADLVDSTDTLLAETRSLTSLEEQPLYDAWSGVTEDTRSHSPQVRNEKAVVCRNLAKTLFVKIGLDATETRMDGVSIDGDGITE